MSAPVIEAQAPAPQASNLPDSFKPKPDTTKADIDHFFDREAREKAAADAPPSTKPAAAAPAAPAAPTKVSLAGALTAAKPAAAAPAAPAPAADPILAEVADLEKKMVAANPKWKPVEGWTQLKTSLQREADARKVAEKKAAELEEKVKTAPVAAGMTAEQIETLKKQHQEASDRLMVADLKNHPKFQEEYLRPKQIAMQRAKEMLEMHGIKADVEALVAKPAAEIGKAVAEALKDVPAFDQVEISTAIRAARTIEENSQRALGNAREMHSQFQKQGAERAKTAFETVFMPVAKEIAQNITLLQAPENATAEQIAEVEEYNTAMRAIEPNARKLALEATGEEDVSRGAMKAAAYDFHVKHVQPRLLKEFSELQTLNQQLTEELKAIKSRNPNLKIGGIESPGSGGGSGEKDPSKMSHAEAAEYFASRPSSP